MRHRFELSALLIIGALATSASAAFATPLAKEVCDTLKTEQDALAAKGVKDDIAKGAAAAAKANLKADRLSEIKRYIEVEEQLLFRCGLARARYVAPPELEAQPAKPEPEKAVPPKAKPKPKPKPQEKAVVPAGAPAQPKAAAKSDAAPSVAQTTQGQTAPAKTVQAKPKPKTDDAFRPPSSAQQKE